MHSPRIPVTVFHVQEGGVPRMWNGLSHWKTSFVPCVPCVPCISVEGRNRWGSRGYRGLLRGLRESRGTRNTWNARQARDTELIGYATEIRMYAEIRAGELLADMEKAKGTRSQLKGDVPVGGSAPKPPTDTTPTLKQLGITKTQSSKWQNLAALPEEKFEAKVEKAKQKAEDSTTWGAT